MKQSLRSTLSDLSLCFEDVHILYMTSRILFSLFLGIQVDRKSTTCQSCDEIIDSQNMQGFFSNIPQRNMVVWQHHAVEMISSAVTGELVEEEDKMDEVKWAVQYEDRLTTEKNNCFIFLLYC